MRNLLCKQQSGVFVAPWCAKGWLGVKIHFFLGVQVFHLHVCMYAVCMPGVHSRQKRLLTPLCATSLSMLPCYDCVLCHLKPHLNPVFGQDRVCSIALPVVSHTSGRQVVQQPCGTDPCLTDQENGAPCRAFWLTSLGVPGL